MDIDMHDQLETKASYAAESAQPFNDLMRAFEGFKAANDERIAAIERRGGDVLLEEKVARIDAALDTHARRLDEIALKSARPSFGGAGSNAPARNEHKAAFNAYVRAGESTGLRQLEAKAMSIGSNPDGGYLVPAEVEVEISKRLTA